ncbi:MAG: ribosomal RNA small subunit methyltransferase A [Candidatus Marinimicrobia bacterium]|nr:ribosomal RNA small subunit methyltransferase A [Candidatus Neomarinimicrobiota bacterium]
MKHRPRKQFGQNFLGDPNIVEKIVALVPQDDATILEIGPGHGALTEKLSQFAKKLIAVEIDRDLVVELQEKFKDYPNVEIRSADVLKMDLSQFGEKLHIVGNLPFNITSPILFRLFHQKKYIESATLMVQKEVTERISAKVGSSNYGVLSVISQFLLKILEQFEVPASAFYPVPKVDATVFLAKFRQLPNTEGIEISQFHQFVKKIFAHRRKTLGNNLKFFAPTLLSILRKQFDTGRRPQTLSLNEIIKIFQIYRQSILDG